MRQTFCWWCFPPPSSSSSSFLLNSLSLLSQLPNVSFDVYCWDFKRTLSTLAGVGFSEQARVPQSSRAEKWVPPHSYLREQVPWCWVSSARPSLLRRLPVGRWVHTRFPPFRRDLSPFRAAEERLSNSWVLRFH